MTWKALGPQQWVLFGSNRTILAAVRLHGPSRGHDRVVYEVSGPLCRQGLDFATLAEARTAVEEMAAPTLRSGGGTDPGGEGSALRRPA